MRDEIIILLVASIVFYVATGVVLQFLGGYQWKVFATAGLALQLIATILFASERHPVCGGPPLG